MASEDQGSLLEALRNVREVPPDPHAELMKALHLISNQLDDLKLKLDINNEVGLELLEQGKRRARPNNATQAWPVRNKPPSSW